MVGLKLIGFDDLLNLLISESTRVIATATRSSSTLEIAAWLVAGRIGKLETSTLEAKTKIKLSWRHVVAPEKVHS